MGGLDITSLIYRVIALLLAITVHEFAHGYIAYRLGDPTAKMQGRLTFNPLAHLDPIGGLMLLVFRFGWAKPVPVNPRYFKDPKKGMLATSLAGPGSNVLMAYILAIPFKLEMSILFLPMYGPILQTLLIICMQYNLLLAAFNLIPVPPLDGSKILWGLLPNRFNYIYYQFEQYGYIVLLLLIITGFTGYLIYPLYTLFLRFVLL